MVMAICVWLSHNEKVTGAIDGSRNHNDSQSFKTRIYFIKVKIGLTVKNWVIEKDKGKEEAII